MKELIITPEDLEEIEVESRKVKVNYDDIIDGELKKVYDLIKSRKLTTYDIITNKLGVKRRTARNYADILVERGLVGKQYEMIKCADSVKRRTALYYELKKEHGKRERNNKKV